MENQAITVGEFYEGDASVRTPSLEDSGDIFDVHDQPANGEFTYPKLDGILLPIVVTNAEVIAPCRWMDGAEVSLTVALNNYYQAMTEENADEVIADVYDFLLHPVELVELIEAPEMKKEEVESPTQTQTTQHAERATGEKQSDNVSPSSQTQHRDHYMNREEELQDVSQKRSDSKKEDEPVKGQVQEISATISGSVATGNDSRPNEDATTIPLAKVETNQKVQAMEMLDEDVVIDTANMPLSVPEQATEPQVYEEVDFSAATEGAAQYIHEVDIPHIDEVLPLDIYGVDSQDERVEDGADSTSDSVSLELEADEPGDDLFDLTKIGDEEGNGSTEAFVSFSYNEDHENPGGSLIDNLTDEAYLGTGAKEQNELIDVQLQAVERIREALSDIIQYADASGPAMQETKSMIESVIAELSYTLGGDKNSATERSEIDIEKELQELLMKLLDDMSLTHESALLDVLALLNREQQLGSEADETAKEIAPTTSLYSRAKSLLFVVSALIKRISSRAIYVGKTVLQLHASDPKGDYQRIVSYS